MTLPKPLKERAWCLGDVGVPCFMGVVDTPDFATIRIHRHFLWNSCFWITETISRHEPDLVDGYSKTSAQQKSGLPGWQPKILATCPPRRLTGRRTAGKSFTHNVLAEAEIHWDNDILQYSPPDNTDSDN